MTTHRNIFLQYKPTRCTISQIYFDKELYMFRTVLLSIIRRLNTVYTAKGICHASYVDCLLALSGWNSDESTLSILTASPGEHIFHCNKYVKMCYQTLLLDLTFR